MAFLGWHGRPRKKGALKLQETADNQGVVGDQH